MKYDQDIRMRLKRAEGQVRGVLKMMEEEKDCREVVNQLSAVRNALDRAIAHIVAVNLEQCIIEEQHNGGDTNQVVKEAIDLLIKSR